MDHVIRPTSTRETWRTSPIAAPKVKSREAASIHWPQESERKLRKGRLLQKKTQMWGDTNGQGEGKTQATK